MRQLDQLPTCGRECDSLPCSRALRESTRVTLLVLARASGAVAVLSWDLGRGHALVPEDVHHGPADSAAHSDLLLAKNDDNAASCTEGPLIERSSGDGASSAPGPRGGWRNARSSHRSASDRSRGGIEHPADRSETGPSDTSGDAGEPAMGGLEGGARGCRRWAYRHSGGLARSARHLYIPP
jgi:hypothetical protein